MPTRPVRAKSSHGWKAMQSHVKIKKRTKLALFALGLIIALLVLGQLVSLTRALFSPWKAQSSKNYLWDGQFNINIVLGSNPVSLFSYNPKEKKITLIKIPDETYLEVPGGFGSWQVRAIYDLGESSKIGGNLLLSQSLSSFLGVPIDGFLEPVDNLKQREAEEMIELLRQNPMSILTLLTGLKTDLTLWELIHLKLSLSNVRFDKVKILDLSKLNVLDQEELADGSMALSADPIKIDSILSDFADLEIQREHLSIAVFNATDHPLLSKKAARLITNMGGNVIISGNASQKLEKTIISGKPSATLKRLIQIFNCQCDKIDLKDFSLDSSRGQINLFLGEDFYSKN